MVVIVVVGMPGAGKDVFLKVAREMGFGHVRMGDVVRHHASEAGLGVGDTSIGGFADSERKRHGPDVWARRTLERLPPGDAVIDGSRSMNEISVFRHNLGDELVVVSVEAPAKARFERLRQRGRDDDPMTFEDFERREVRELSWGIDGALGAADIKLENGGGIEEFREECRALLERLRARGQSI